MSSDKIAIIGYSGHAHVVLDTAASSGLRITCYCERREMISNPFDLKYLGDESSVNFNWEDDCSFVLGVGDNKLRYNLAKEIEKKGKEIISVIHTTSVISQLANYGVGVFVNGQAIVNAFSEIGNYAILNTGCIVEHECALGEAVHVGPGAVLTGAVRVGDRTFIGANAVVRQGVKIGRDVIIGAGTVVLSDVEDGEVLVGNPGKKLKSR